jgi:chromosome segregation ATPase
MGQDPGTSGTAITGDAQPEQLREQIEETRRELGDTVEALAAKTDVKAQAKRKLEETKSSVAAKKDELVGKARSASPGSASGAAAQISEQARAHPARAAAAGAFLAGFLTGRVTKR